MSDNGWTVKTPSGKGLEEHILSISDAAKIEETDIQYALDRDKERILERTARGLDFNGLPFRQYNSTRPYYDYPGKGTANRGANRATAFRKAAKGGIAEHLFDATDKKTYGYSERGRLGIKYSSYGAFKAALGRSWVDLTGPRAPHMLQALVVRVRGMLGAIGIYGPEADRARGHNEGTKTLPRRRFLDASDDDKALIQADILARIKARIKRSMSG